MGKSEKVECTVPIRLTLSFSRLPELGQPRLLWMNGQAETTKSLRQDFHDPAGIFLNLKTHDKIISKTDQKASTLHPGPDLFYKPFIQYMMKEYVAQHRGNDSMNAKGNLVFLCLSAVLMLDWNQKQELNVLS